MPPMMPRLIFTEPKPPKQKAKILKLDTEPEPPEDEEEIGDGTELDSGSSEEGWNE